MARRIRTIKPEILDSESTSLLRDAAWRLFVSTLTLADDYGNLSGNSDWLAAQVFWSRNTVPMGDLVEELVRAELVTAYTVHGRHYLHINKFSEHQKVEKPGSPKVPGPEMADKQNSATPLECSPTPLEHSPLEGKGREGKGRERKGEDRNFQPAKEPPAKKAGAKPKASHEDIAVLIDEYNRLWLERYRPQGGESPKLLEADRGQAARLVRVYPVEKALGFVRAYFADTHPIAVDSGHAFSLISKRIVAYEAGVKPRAPGSRESRQQQRAIVDPMPAATHTYEADLG